jgi:2-phosphoglycerate kinase
VIQIIKGYKLQCKLVQDKLEHVIRKYNDTNDSIIIEGVHLTPNFMF